MTTKTTISPELLDELLANYSKPEDLTGEDGLFKQLKKALIERALGAELTEHLGYEKGDPAGRRSGNSRNGTSSKTLLTEDGEVKISVPRDRAGLPTIYQGAFWVFSEGSNRVPALSMAQATLRRRSATDRKARPWL